ncbi:MAG: hypothetical protein ACERKZ_15730 [Lachnotalea sp.]
MYILKKSMNKESIPVKYCRNAFLIRRKTVTTDGIETAMESIAAGTLLQAE